MSTIPALSTFLAPEYDSTPEYDYSLEYDTAPWVRFLVWMCASNGKEPSKNIKNWKNSPCTWYQQNSFSQTSQKIILLVIISFLICYLLILRLRIIYNIYYIFWKNNIYYKESCSQHIQPQTAFLTWTATVEKFDHVQVFYLRANLKRIVWFSSSQILYTTILASHSGLFLRKCSCMKYTSCSKQRAVIPAVLWT